MSVKKNGEEQKWKMERDANVNEEECRGSKMEDGEDANVIWEANSKSNVFGKCKQLMVPVDNCATITGRQVQMTEIVPQLMDNRKKWKYEGKWRSFLQCEKWREIKNKYLGRKWRVSAIATRGHWIGNQDLVCIRDRDKHWALLMNQLMPCKLKPTTRPSGIQPTNVDALNFAIHDTKWVAPIDQQ